MNGVNIRNSQNVTNLCSIFQFLNDNLVYNIILAAHMYFLNKYKKSVQFIIITTVFRVKGPLKFFFIYIIHQKLI